MQGAGCRVQGAGCRVQGAGCRVQGAGCRVQGAGCRVQDAGCRVQGVLLRAVPAIVSEKSLSVKSRTYRGISLVRNSAPQGPYSRTMPGALWWS